MSNVISIILVVVVTLALLIFLIWKNMKDKKLLNPDAQDSVEETMMDKDRRKDKI